MNKKTVALSILFACFFQFRQARAESSGAAFLKIDPSPRSYALGGANAITSQGAQATSGNPANLALTSRRYEMFSSFSNLMNQETYGFISFALNRSAAKKRLIEGLGGSVTYLTVSDLEGRDRSGQKTGSFGMHDQSMALSASMLLNQQLRLGLTGKAVQSEIGGYRSSLALASDIGMSYELRSLPIPVMLGSMARNLGQSVQFISQRDPLPASLELGAGVDISPATIILGVSHLLYDKKTRLSLGMEFNMGPLALRAGYQSGAAKSGKTSSLLQSFSTGAGIHLGRMKLDYAVGQQPDEGGIAHRAALSIDWGSPIRSNRRKIQAYEPGAKE